MDDFIIEMKEETPVLKTKKCRLIALVLQLFLTYGIYVFGLVSWYMYDAVIAFFTLVLSFVVMGIVRSKLRNSSIPLKQIEFTYTDEDIAKWFVSKEIC